MSAKKLAFLRKLVSSVSRPSKRAAAKKNATNQARAIQLVIDYDERLAQQLTPPSNGADYEELGYLRQRLPTVRTVKEEAITGNESSSLIVGLGFEERTLHSLQAILRRVRPREVLCVGYSEKGNRDAMLGELSNAGCKVSIIESSDTAAMSEFASRGATLVDVSGLSKPLIFHAVRMTLLAGNLCTVGHGVAAKHYPSNEEITRQMKEHRSSDQYGLLEALAKITKTERKPYTLQGLLPSSVDETRARALCAFVSAKPERLLSLLDQRDYDRIFVGIPSSKTPRSKLAAIAAEVIAKNYPNTSIFDIGRDDVDLTVDWLITAYHSLFVEEGCNVEVSLTGSKIQTVVAAALSTVLKFSACWYVSPASFNPEHFSDGYVGTEWLEVAAAKTR